MSHLTLSLMNKLNKTKSAVFKLWMLYFQMITFQIITPPPQPRKLCCFVLGGGGYSVFTLSVRPSVRDALVFPLYLEKAVIEIHQIFQTL